VREESEQRAGHRGRLDAGEELVERARAAAVRDVAVEERADGVAQFRGVGRA
jgi:hypothetical protein